MKTQILILLTAAATVISVQAEPQTFDFKDPKNINNASFKLVAPKETIEGNANGITGSVTFDLENPAATKGKVVVAGKSLTVPNGMMKSHLQGAMWVDVAKYPEITFEIKELKDAKTEGGTVTASAIGTFTLKDVSKEVTVPVTLSYLKDKLSERIPGQKGDLLVVKCSFSILRSDYHVNAHQNEDKVADKIDLTIGAAGAAAKQ